MDEINKAYEELHKDYEHRKAEIITKLTSIKDSKITNNVKKIWINQAIKFIKEKSFE